MRVSIKIGDIFSVKVDDEHVKYFQFIITDKTQLSSDVIRAFKDLYPAGSSVDLMTIISGEVDFYTHAFIRVGCKMGYWEKVGHHLEVGRTDHILFRNSGDYGNPTIKISNDWWVWNINHEQKRVGKLLGDNTKAEIGVVMDPESIVHKMKFGFFDGFYPEYE